MSQMDNTMTKEEIAALLAVVEDWGKRRRKHCRMFSLPMPAKERDTLQVARRAMAKVHKLFKQGALKDQQHQPAGDAGP